VSVLFTALTAGAPDEASSIISNLHEHQSRRVCLACSALSRWGCPWPGDRLS